ncbi:MAG: hypothetical protein Q4E67_02570, partial [Planctomycetia bacterium]|nr:hypothetical protein [Planctomycetia bacterium]
MNPPSFHITAPLPKYGSEESLQRQLFLYLLNSGFSPGDRFLTDWEVMEATRKSRTVVRRALACLSQEGWIAR